MRESDNSLNPPDAVAAEATLDLYEAAAHLGLSACILPDCVSYAFNDRKLIALSTAPLAFARDEVEAYRVHLEAPWPGTTRIDPPEWVKRYVRLESQASCGICRQRRENYDYAHIEPWPRSRCNSPNNLLYLCVECHRTHGSDLKILRQAKAVCAHRFLERQVLDQRAEAERERGQARLARQVSLVFKVLAAVLGVTVVGLAWIRHRLLSNESVLRREIADQASKIAEAQAASDRLSIALREATRQRGIDSKMLSELAARFPDTKCQISYSGGDSEGQRLCQEILLGLRAGGWYVTPGRDDDTPTALPLPTGLHITYPMTWTEPSPAVLALQDFFRDPNFGGVRVRPGHPPALGWLGIMIWPLARKQ